MANLDTITPDTIADRFFTLPPKIQDALENTALLQTVRVVCSKYQIADTESVALIEKLAAAVLLGFVHTDELQDVLQSEVGLAKDVAQKAASDLYAQIFAPLRQELDAVYAPAPGMVPAPIPTPMRARAPQPVSLDALTITPRPQAPTGVPTATTIPAKFTMPTAPAAPAAPAGPINRAASIAPINPTAPAQPAPFMLHQETSTAPLASAGSGFKLNVSADMFKSAGPAKKMDIPMPPKVAELEIGRAPIAPKKPTGPIVTTPAARVVHYTDFRTTVAPGFGMNSDIKPMPATPKAPAPIVTAAPKIPASVPQPPKPPAVTQTPAAPAAPTTPGTPTAPPKPKVVNFGPEEVK